MRPALIFFAFVGHAFLWIGLVNRLHALGIPRRIIKLATLLCFLCAALIPVGMGWWKMVENADTDVGVLAGAYVVGCEVVAAVTLLRLVWLQIARRTPSLVRFRGRRRADINLAAAAANPGELAHHWLTRLPLNEILQLETTQWVLDVPRLVPALDGLSVVHLSDFHILGRVGKAFFREVVRTSNELQPDLVCITGDIMERAACLDWIPDTLGQLSARYGVFFILGNHDRKVYAGRLRRTLTESGLVDLGGCSHSIQIQGAPVELIGNERPWFDGWGSSVGRLKRTSRPSQADDALHAPYSLRIVLAHSPDQLAWARAQDADLMLAGHTHGGQIRIPPLGAIFSPTASGVRYISGIFHVRPTILHVSRGLSGDVPVRWNCPPEIAHLRLRAGPNL